MCNKIGNKKKNNYTSKSNSYIEINNILLFSIGIIIICIIISWKLYF